MRAQSRRVATGHQPFGRDLDAVHGGVADVAGAEIRDASRVLHVGADLLVVVSPVKGLDIDQQAIGEQPAFGAQRVRPEVLQSLEKKNPPDLKSGLVAQIQKVLPGEVPIEAARQVQFETGTVSSPRRRKPRSSVPSGGWVGAGTVWNSPSGTGTPGISCVTGTRQLRATPRNLDTEADRPGPSRIGS